MNKLEKIYNDVSLDTINLMKELCENHENTFLIPTRFISEEIAQVAYLLDEYYNYNKDDSHRKTYRSFFVNSRFEAVQGAIKLIRAKGYSKYQGEKNKIVILDTTDEMNLYVNPLGSNEEEALIKDIIFVSSYKELKEVIETNDDLIGAILRNCSDELDVKEYEDIINICIEKDIISLLDECDVNLEKENVIHKIENVPDMVILGEALTSYEVPFALFSMTEEVHEPWANFQNCLEHSSTYSGNRLAIRKAKNNLLNKVDFLKNNEVINNRLEEIQNNIDDVIECYKKYINPGIIYFFIIAGYDFLCRKADGSKITIETNKKQQLELIDVVSGGGATVLGHGPKELLNKVINDYEEGHDYFSELRDKIFELFSLNNIFPAVSGATAVENAFLLSTVANKSKKRIVVFKNNYAGKTIVSSIGTDETDKVNISKYDNVVYFDPYQENAEEKLNNLLSDSDIGLVWFENTQGGTLHKIPENLVRVVQRNKEKMGYFVGIDEILMGFYRLSTLKSYNEDLIQPDIVTFSKVTSGGIYPMGLTAVSNDLYSKAKEANNEIVYKLENRYKNQFSAFVALNCINIIVEKEFVNNLLKVSAILEEGFEELKKSPFVKNIYGKGHIYRIEYNDEIGLKSFFFCSKMLNEAKVFMYIDRVVPALTLSEEEARELISRFKNILSANNLEKYNKEYELYCKELLN